MFSRKTTAILLSSSRSQLRTIAPQPQAVAALHSSARAGLPHSSDSYNKDVDVTPPEDSKIHRVDPGSENAQKPYEPPSGKWSQAGVGTKEYESVSKTEPYNFPGADKRYGGKEQYDKEKGPETSKSGDGPTGKAREGMKPE